MGLWAAQFWETVFAKASLKGTNDSAPTIRGPKSRALQLLD